MNSTEARDVKRAIKAWLTIGYPHEYLVFFFHWSLFNAYYKLISMDGGDHYKVRVFGRKYNNIWNNEIRNSAKQLVTQECVGKGKGENPPSDSVKAATNQLRDLLGVNKEDICNNCRTRKKINCSKVAEKGKFERLGALLEIIYQIRNNLIHGDKLELTGEQGDRNKELVKLSNPILEQILQNL